MLTNDQWQKLWQFLITERHFKKQTPMADRTFIEAVIWLSVHDMHWQSLPDQYGAWFPIYKRLVRWRKRGLLSRIMTYFANDSTMHPMVEALKRAQAYAQPLATPDPPASLSTPQPHPAQSLILADPTRFRVVACGRRFGKTELGKLEVLKLLDTTSNAVIWWVSPTHKMAIEVWDDFTQALAPLAERINRTYHTIYLPDNRILAIRSAHDPHRLRGSGLDLLVMDEAAFCPEKAWHALRPALSDRNGKALFLSTPRGRNWFWQLYAKGIDPLETEWTAWRLPTSTNPHIAPGEVESASRDLPERMFLQEYQAEFLEDYGLVFRSVLECVHHEPLMRRGNEPTVIGLDWGRVNDFTVAVVFGVHTRRVLQIDRFNQIKWSAQRDRIAQLARIWQPRVILAESNSIGSPNIEALFSEGLPIRPFHMSATTKALLIDKLALAIEEKSIALPNHPILLHELQSFEMEHMRNGTYRYSAPANGHDDCVIALALALHAVTNIPFATVRKYA